MEEEGDMVVEVLEKEKEEEEEIEDAGDGADVVTVVVVSAWTKTVREKEAAGAKNEDGEKKADVGSGVKSATKSGRWTKLKMMKAISWARLIIVGSRLALL